MLEYSMVVDCGIHHEHSNWYTEEQFAEFSMKVVNFMLTHPAARPFIEKRIVVQKPPRKKVIDF